MANRLYPDSKIELTPTILKHYDRIMNSISFGKYNQFIRRAVFDMQIKSDDHILDLGCGTGKNASLMLDYLGEKGKITGVDISPVMEKQFLDKHRHDKRIDFQRERVDIPFELGTLYDKVLISFVIHGFPHEVRKQMLRNASSHLKPGGKLMILDFSEFDMAEMPAHHRFVFKKVECVYAFDFIERDWKQILMDFGFNDFSETLYFRKYARLLLATKKQ